MLNRLRVYRLTFRSVSPIGSEWNIQISYLGFSIFLIGLIDASIFWSLTGPLNDVNLKGASTFTETVLFSHPPSSIDIIMIWYQVFQDGPEYEARKKKGTFSPPNLSIKDVRDAVPPHLFERSTLKSLFYIFRHLSFTCIFYYIATQIDVLSDWVAFRGYPFAYHLVRTTLWILYWGWQGVTFAGIWCLGMILRTRNLRTKF